MQILIGNLNMMTTARQLAELFLPYGKVISSRIVGSVSKGRSRGLGLVEMDNPSGKQAIRKLHLLLFMNYYIEVDEVLS